MTIPIELLRLPIRSSRHQALSQHGKIEAIADFIVNGNETIQFNWSSSGSGFKNASSQIGGPTDISRWILEDARIGTCDEYSSTFALMLRTAGIPSRKVMGLSDGSQNLDNTSFSFYGRHLTSWVEAHLQTNENLGESTLGGSHSRHVRHRRQFR